MELIANQVIRTQEELIAALKKDGIEATQATVSRDIKTLRLQKVPAAGGGTRYAVSPARAAVDPEVKKKYRSVLRSVILSAVPAGNLVVIKTLSGTANAAAAALEYDAPKEIIGTLAGDDTVLCVCATDRAAQLFSNQIQDSVINSSGEEAESLRALAELIAEKEEEPTGGNGLC